MPDAGEYFVKCRRGTDHGDTKSGCPLIGFASALFTDRPHLEVVPLFYLSSDEGPDRPFPRRHEESCALREYYEHDIDKIWGQFSADLHQICPSLFTGCTQNMR